MIFEDNKVDDFTFDPLGFQLTFPRQLPSIVPRTAESGTGKKEWDRSSCFSSLFHICERSHSLPDLA